MKVSGSEDGTVTGTIANSFKEKGSDDEPNKSVSVLPDVGGGPVHTKILKVYSNIDNKNSIRWNIF